MMSRRNNEIGIDRGTYALYIFVSPFVVGIVIGLLGGDEVCLGVSYLGLAALYLWASAERLKNINENQWLCLLALVPLINLGLLLYLLFTPPYVPPKPKPRGEIQPPTAVYCPKCGAPRQGWYKVCPNCGNEFEE
jgi:hypothetical protein